MEWGGIPGRATCSMPHRHTAAAPALSELKRLHPKALNSCVLGLGLGQALCQKSPLPSFRAALQGTNYPYQGLER